MTGRDDLEAVIRRELSTTVDAAYGTRIHLTARYNQATARILFAHDAILADLADHPAIAAQRRQELADLTKRGPRNDRTD